MEVFRCHMSTDRPALLNMSLARLGRVSCLSEGFVYSNNPWGHTYERQDVTNACSLRSVFGDYQVCEDISITFDRPHSFTARSYGEA